MKTRYEDSLFYQIHSTAKYFDKLFEQFFKSINMGVSSSEHLALMIIYDLKNCCQRDLAKILLKDRANTGKLVLALQEKGLINIELKTKNNRPVKILTVTKKGINLVNESMILFEPLRKQIESVFTQEKIDEIKKSLSDFRNSVSKTIKVNI